MTATVDGDDGYAFRHALVYEAAYADLLPGERRALHRDFALAMEADSGQDAAGAGRAVEIAHHWRSARDLARGLGASILAGDESAEAYAFAQSLAEYEHALIIWDQLSDPEGSARIDRIELLRRTARSAHLSSEDRRAIGWLREAIELSRSADDGTRTGVLLEQLGRVLWVSGDAISAVTISEAAVAAIPVEPPTAERARAISGLAQVLMLNGQFRRSRDLCLDAVAIARAAGARVPEGHALNTLGMDLAHMGEVEPAVEALEQALAIAWEVRNADDVGRAFVNLSDTLWMVGEPAAALRRVEEGVRASSDLGVESVYGYYLRMNGIFLAWELGEWATAGRLYREAMARSLDGGGAERYRLAYALHWLVAIGSEEADDAWTRAWELIGTDPSATHTGPPPHLAGIELRLWQGRPVEAFAIAEDGLRRLGSGSVAPSVARAPDGGARGCGCGHDLRLTRGSSGGDRPDPRPARGWGIDQSRTWAHRADGRASGSPWSSQRSMPRPRDSATRRRPPCGLRSATAGPHGGTRTTQRTRVRDSPVRPPPRATPAPLSPHSSRLTPSRSASAPCP